MPAMQRPGGTVYGDFHIHHPPVSETNQWPAGLVHRPVGDNQQVSGKKLPVSEHGSFEMG